MDVSIIPAAAGCRETGGRSCNHTCWIARPDPKRDVLNDIGPVLPLSPAALSIPRDEQLQGTGKVLPSLRKYTWASELICHTPGRKFLRLRAARKGNNSK